MKAWHSLLTRTAVAPLLVLAAFTVSCREAGEPTAPGVQAARAGDNDGGSPTVSSVVPGSSERGVTLDITVNGSGFDSGSVARLERQGVPSAKITTNSTTYVTSTNLIANITIAADADTGKYDVGVTNLRGRKGVGVELFDVRYELVDVGVIGGTWSKAMAINDRGQVVGTSCTQSCVSHAFFWTERGGLEDLGTLPGFTRSGAYSINNRGQVLGNVRCPAADSGCGSGSSELVVWERFGGRWNATRLGIPGFIEDGDINNWGQFVAMGRLYSLSGDLAEAPRARLGAPKRAPGQVAAAVREPLPHLGPPTATSYARAINDLGVVVGQSVPNDGTGAAEAVFWFRDQSGTWRILALGHLPGQNISLVEDIGEVDLAGRIRVVGNSAVAYARDGAHHPVRWTLERDGTGGWRVAEVEALQLPPKATRSAWVWGVNAEGDAVGDYSYRADGDGGYGYADAVVWLPSGDVEWLLPAPTGGWARARDINKAGRIVGSVWDNARACERAAFWRPR